MSDTAMFRSIRAKMDEGYTMVITADGEVTFVALKTTVLDGAEYSAEDAWLASIE